MGDTNSKEDYLDGLLNSVSGDKTAEELELMSLRSQLKKMRNADEREFDTTSYSDEDFMKSLEEDIDEEEFSNFISEFEDELDEHLENLNFDSIEVETTDKKGKESISEIKDIDMDAFSEIVGELNQEARKKDSLVPDESNMEQTQDEPDLSMELDEEPELSVSEAGEIDLSGNNGNDLMDMLSESDELKEIGDLLSGDVELEGVDEIGDFAQQEMQQNRGGEAEHPKEKTGFLAKLARFFFGEDEEEEEELIPGASAGDGNENITLTKENQAIIDELEGAKDKKGKKKKEKKPKKEKPKKEKPKKEKKPKEPKPKKEKPVDNTPPLPKGPVILIFIMAFSLMALVLLGTNLGGYTVQVNEAAKLLKNGSYAQGYATIDGNEIKKKDEKLYNQLAVLSPMDSELHNYEVFMANNKRDMALDSLVCAAGRYEVNLEGSKEWDCNEELELMKNKVEGLLQEQFGMSFEEALSIYNLKDRELYSREILKKIKQLGLE